MNQHDSGTTEWTRFAWRSSGAILGPRAATGVLVACACGRALTGSSADAHQSHPREHAHLDVVVDGADSQPFEHMDWAESRWQDRSGGISTTPDNRVLLELAPDDTTTASPFDLNGRTLVFTLDGNGGYSRAVRPATWEPDIGGAVRRGEEVEFPGFHFDFTGRRWDSFFVSRHGGITFGDMLTYSHRGLNLGSTMREIADTFVTTPTMSRASAYPYGVPIPANSTLRSLWGRSSLTWVKTDTGYFVHGRPPLEPVRFQLVAIALVIAWALVRNPSASSGEYAAHQRA